MGTRSDMYVGKGKDAEWIGSIAFDGYRRGIDDAVLQATTAHEFRAAFAEFVEDRDDYTAPEQGWPWPWPTSATSDCSYWFFDGKVWEAVGHPERYAPCDEPEPETDEECEARGRRGDIIDFPDMSARQKVTFGSRSGLTIVTARGIVE